MTLRSIVPSLIVSLSLSACSGDACADACSSTEDVPSDDTQVDANGDCVSSCDSGDSDTPVGTATLTYTVYRLGVIEDSLVNIGDVTESSGTAIEVLAPADYTVTAGDSSYNEQFGFPVQVDQEGEYWAAPPADISVENGDDIPGRFDLFNLFEPGDYTCSYDKYELDLSASDYKGEYQRTVDHDPVYVAVNENGKVEPENENENWDVVGSADDYMQVEDDQLNLVVVDDAITYITESQIGKQNFSLTIVDETFGYTADVTCSQ